MIYDISPDSTALLIIDAQQEYFSQDGALYTENAESIRSNLVEILSAARSAGVSPIFIKHVHALDGSDVGRMGDFDETEVFGAGTPGVEIIPDLEVGSDPIVEKTRYSAFVNTSLESFLKTGAIDTLIVTGLMTQYCSVTTARHAHDLDYKVIFVPDANAGPDLPDLGFGPVDHSEASRVIATSLAGGVADVVDTQTLIGELSRAN